MGELRRILTKRRLIVGFLLILVLNGFLFAREQSGNDYGLDLELPSSGGYVTLDGAFTVTQETVDARAAYQRYSEWLDRVRSMPLADAAALLTNEKTALSEKITGDTDTENDRLDYVAVNNLLIQTDYLTGYGDWLENIQKNKENLLTFSIFNDPDSFSGRNIIKTADEFEKLEGVELTLGTDGAADAFMTFRLTDYFLLVVLLYGTNLVIGLSLYGGMDDLSRAVQSVETLGRLTTLTTVGGFLVRFFLLRVAAAFLIALILWLLLTAINNVKYTIIVAAGVLVAEYGLYTFLPVQSAFNMLKYFNLFTYISLSDLYTNYLNIDIFTYPLGIRNISQLALFPLCLILASVCVYVHCHKKPAAGRDLLGRVAYGINSITDKFLRRLHLAGMELHKTLWIQKGVVIAALLVYVALGLTYTVKIPVNSSEEQAARQYTTEFAGEITDDTFARMDAEQAELDAVIAASEDAKIAYENGEIEYPIMTFLLKSTARGRGALLLRKLLLAAVTTTLVWGVVYGLEVYTLLSGFDILAWSAPVRNLSMLAEFPLNCSITGWLVFLYACRWLCLLCGAVIVLLVSSLFRRMEAAYIATVGVMPLPSLLYVYMGIEVFRPLSMILPVAAMPLLTAASGAIFAYLLWIAALIVIAAIIIVLLATT